MWLPAASTLGEAEPLGSAEDRRQGGDESSPTCERGRFPDDEVPFSCERGRFRSRNFCFRAAAASGAAFSTSI